MRKDKYLQGVVLALGAALVFLMVFSRPLPTPLSADEADALNVAHKFVKRVITTEPDMATFKQEVVTPDATKVVYTIEGTVVSREKSGHFKVLLRNPNPGRDNKGLWYLISVEVLP